LFACPFPLLNCECFNFEWEEAEVGGRCRRHSRGIGTWTVEMNEILFDRHEEVMKVGRVED